jgi:hypothetical protein
MGFLFLIFSLAGKEGEEEEEHLSAAFITSVGVSSSYSSNLRSKSGRNLSLTKAEEDALAALYGGAEEDKDDGADEGEESGVDKDAHDPAARFGAAVKR